jgi:putative ABC transport system ATP-binding protein
MTQPDDSVVRTEALSKEYRTGAAVVRALHNVSLAVRHGEMVAIMGPSGSGKTTLLNLLGCVEGPTRGRYWLDGQDVSRLGDQALSRIRNQKIGFVFQGFNLLPRLTALKNVELPLTYASRRVKRAASRDALARVGLSGRGRHRPSELSGGEQQRVAIARALVMQPAIVLADEPTGNLDSRTGEEIMQLFQELNDSGVTLLVVTHDAHVARHAARVVEMLDGRIVGDQVVTDRVDARQALAEMPARATAVAGEAS